MKIAVVGAGHVGGVLGKRWSEMGHRVMYGVRSLDDAKAKALLNEHSELGGIAEAAAWADVILLAVPYEVVAEAITSMGQIKGKIILDATNPLVGLDALQLGTTTSGGEHVQELAEDAHVVKVFNTTGYNVMEDPGFSEGKPTMFLCGDDDEAKAVARTLSFELGFDPIDAGPMAQARLLEPLALLWITLAVKFGQGRDMAFRLMKR